MLIVPSDHWRSQGVRSFSYAPYWQNWQSDDRGAQMSDLEMPQSMVISGMTVAEARVVSGHPHVGASASRFIVKCHGYRYVFIQPENHVILCRLAYQLQHEGIIFTEPIDGNASSRANGVKYINVIRNDFRFVGIDGSALIVSDNHGRYALTIDSTHLLVDWERLSRSRDSRLSKLGTAALGKLKVVS